MLRAIGQWTTKIRRMAGEFQSQFQEAMREAEMADLKKSVDELSDVTKGITADPFDFSESTKWEPKTDTAADGGSRRHLGRGSAGCRTRRHLPATRGNARRPPTADREPRARRRLAEPAREPPHRPTAEPMAEGSGRA